jgi:hypothetical protein
MVHGCEPIRKSRLDSPPSLYSDGNLDRRHQMADMNDLESTLLKVCNSFLVEVVSEEGRMDQCDSICSHDSECVIETRPPRREV